MKILSRDEIEKKLSIPHVLKAIEEGFILYSRGETVIPLPAALHFDTPPGDCHIKYGYAKNGKLYVVKVASGFYDNPQKGLASTNGLVLLFDKETGRLVSILLDEGFLTDMRTAAAGCIAAKKLAPKEVSCVGIVGTGAQSYYQLRLLKFATKCRRVMVWGRDFAKASKFAEHEEFREWKIEVAKNLDELTSQCNLIVTTTASSTPLLFARQLRAGTHVTAIGADDIGKQELAEDIFAKADRVIVDSKRQAMLYGDTSYALKKGIIGADQLIELGEVLMNSSLGRTSDDQITVCDLTGIAIQDLQISESVYKNS